MRFVQFFTAPDREALGSNGVAYLDGRHSPATSAHIARSLCRVRGYAGFEVRQGESFTKFTTLHPFEQVQTRK